MSKDKVKTSKITIEFLDNGFVVEVYGHNPYSADLRTKNIRFSANEVVADFRNEINRNQDINDEIKAKEAEKNAN